MIDLLLVFDIDQTMSNRVPRLLNAGPMPPRSDTKAVLEWLEKLQGNGVLLTDPPLKAMCELFKLLGGGLRTPKRVFVTGRGEKHRYETERWLRAHDLHGPVYMRPDTDWQSAADYKEEQMLKLVKEFKPKHVIVLDDDDAEDCSAMYRRNGWTHLKVITPELDELERKAAWLKKASVKAR
jgi:hypothetical protein